MPLELAYDDGDLRFGANAGAGDLTVGLATPVGGTPFVVHVDRTQTDPLLRFALVSQPELTLDVTVAQPDVAPFTARQGFTDVRVTGGHYQVRRTEDITLRDPDGRGLLTLEDLRYSTLPDLFRITPTQDRVDIGFGLRLPDSVAVDGSGDGSGEDARLGTFTLTGPASGDAAWPDPAADGTRSYGDALAAVTGLSLVDGITSLSKYTGAALALQDAADVPFPNLGGGTGDLFAPGDQLLDLLSTSAVAQIRCGLSPGSPPTGTPAPGDTVYCDAVAAEGLGTITGATWSTVGGGTVATTGAADQRKAVGVHPQGTVQIDGSDGEPDVVVTLTLKSGRTMVAPVDAAHRPGRRVPDPAARGPRRPRRRARPSTSPAHRLDVDVDLRDAAVSKPLGVGNPGTLGALVGLTGLEAGGADGPGHRPRHRRVLRRGLRHRHGRTGRRAGAQHRAAAPRRDADPGRGRLRDPAEQRHRAAGPGRLPRGRRRPGRRRLDAVGGPAASLRRLGGATGPLSLGSLLTDQGTLTPGVLGLQSHVTADVSFDARERSLDGDRYASGADGPASGSATVHWGSHRGPVGLDHHRLPQAPPLRPGPGRLPQRYGGGDGGLPGHRSASPPAGRACTPRWVSRPPRASRSRGG